MKIKNGKLLEITEADIPSNGIFENSEITELSDKCFNGINNVKKIILPNCTTFGSDCFYYNAKLTSITLNKATTFGSYCFYHNYNLTSVTLNKAITFGSDCFYINPKLTSVTLNKFKLKTKSVDGYCFVIENTKSTKGIHIYTGYNFIELKTGKIVKQECFVAKKGKFTAHAETVKKAIQDLEFKIISEKLKNEPIKKDTIITIQYYRTITGACELGIKDWMKSNGIKDKIKAIDLLPVLKKTNAYGFEKFKQLYSK